MAVSHSEEPAAGEKCVNIKTRLRLLGPILSRPFHFHDINRESSRYDGARRVLMVQVELWSRVGLNEYYSDPKEV